MLRLDDILVTNTITALQAKRPTQLPPLAPVQNGTMSAARVSDYTWATYGVYPGWTTVQWRVTVPAIPEGVYWATITFTVESI